MTQKEKFQQLTVEDLQKIDDTIHKISGGSIWAKCSPAFWRDVLKELQTEI